MLNYLITGASGLVAKEVIQMLLKQPQDINIFCQSRSKKIPAHLHQYKNNFEWINCSLSKPLPKNLVNKINVILIKRLLLLVDLVFSEKCIYSLLISN